MTDLPSAKWAATTVRSPHIDTPIEVIAAKNILYIPNGHRFQTLSLYLPKTPSTSSLIDTPVTSIPSLSPRTSPLLPQWHVHIHGGAWRDPNLTSSSIEADVAHAFSPSSTSTSSSSFPITAIASINYTLSPFPSHPTLPYDPIKNSHSDPSREALHPKHIHDVLLAFVLLRSLGLSDNSYILSGHSCGACLAFQSILQPPEYYSSLSDVPSPPPRPAAILGMNGLYDLEMLVHGLGGSHKTLRGVYDDLLGIAFGKEEKGMWRRANPARFDTGVLGERLRGKKIPGLVVLDQSAEDQLVPVNQVERFEGHLKCVEGLRVVRGKRCTGKHAAPWEEGRMIWESVLDVLELLGEGKEEED